MRKILVRRNRVHVPGPGCWQTKVVDRAGMLVEISKMKALDGCSGRADVTAKAFGGKTLLHYQVFCIYSFILAVKFPRQ